MQESTEHDVSTAQATWANLKDELESSDIDPNTIREFEQAFEKVLGYVKQPVGAR